MVLKPSPSARESVPSAGRWALAAVVAAFLLIPGHRNLPLSGLPICDLWFFVAFLGWVLLFVILPWKPTPLRAVRWPLLVLAVLCVAKAVVAAADRGHGLEGTYTVVVKPVAHWQRHFEHVAADGTAAVSMSRLDPELDFLDNSFHPFRRSFDLTFFNGRPLFYIDREDAAAAAMTVLWQGWLHVDRDGEQRLAARIPAADRCRFIVDGVAGAWLNGSAARSTSPFTLRAGVHRVRIEYEHAAGKPAASEKAERAASFRLLEGDRPDKLSPVAWWRLAVTPEAAGRWWWGAAAAAVLLAAGVAVGWGAARRVAWSKGFEPRARIRGVLFALLCVQFGASVYMTFRHTAGTSFPLTTRQMDARQQWSIFERYDDRIYERRAQTFLRYGWLSEEAKAEGPIHYSPWMELYVPALHGLFGESYGRMVTFQNLLIAATVPIAFAVGRLLFRTIGAGLAAAALTAVDPSFTEFGRRLLATASSQVLFALSIWALLLARRRGRAWRFAVAGGLFSLMAMARVNMLAALAGVALLILWPGRPMFLRRLAHLGVFLLCAAAVWTAVPLRQHQLTGQWLWMNTQGPTTLIGENVPISREAEWERYQDFLSYIDREVHDPIERKIMLDYGEGVLRPQPRSLESPNTQPMDPARLMKINPHLAGFFRWFLVHRPQRLLDTWWRKACRFFWAGTEGSHFRPYSLMLLAILPVAIRRRRDGMMLSLGVLMLAAAGLLIVATFKERHRMPMAWLIDVMFAGSAVWVAGRVRSVVRRRREARGRASGADAA